MVACEAAASCGPGKGSLNHPAPRLHGEAALPWLRADKFDADRCRLRDARSGIGAICIAQRDERPGAA